MRDRLSNPIGEATFKYISESEPWFPAITPRLVCAAARTLLPPHDLTSRNYSSNSYLDKSIFSGVNVCHQFMIDQESGPKLETLEDRHKLRYEALGLNFCSDHGHNQNAITVLQDAFNALSVIPSLQTSIRYLIMSVHVLTVADDAFDVSHSDPKLPFSVFLSVPSIGAPHSTSRVIESLVHEAMHLQLSLLDEFEPLLIPNEKFIYSPWMDEFRPLIGVFHGMYVFSNVLRALELLVESSRNDLQSYDYLTKRIETIKSDLLVAREQFYLEYLTDFGRLIFGNFR